MANLSLVEWLQSPYTNAMNRQTKYLLNIAQRAGIRAPIHMTEIQASVKLPLRHCFAYSANTQAYAWRKMYNMSWADNVEFHINNDLR